MRSESEARQRSETAEANRIAATRVGAEQRLDESDRLAHVEQLNREAVALEGEAGRSTGNRRRRARDRSAPVRAPVAGASAMSPRSRLGAVVDEGDASPRRSPGASCASSPLSLPPSGRAACSRASPRACASTAFRGRSTARCARRRARRAARRATGACASSSSRAASPRAIPLQHGLPGRIEVEVERRRRLALVLRAAGRLLSRARRRRAERRRDPP